MSVLGPRVSFKYQLWLTLGILSALVLLPVVSLICVTDVSALKDPNITLYTGTASTADTYDFGYCTYWVSLRREQSGHAIPYTWGNANTWAQRALVSGFIVDHIPAAGSIMQTTAGPLGHVAYVEELVPNGDFKVSEMNFKAWDQVDMRTLPIGQANNFWFIH